MKSKSPKLSKNKSKKSKKVLKIQKEASKNDVTC